jgi:microcystin-dependent protein
MTGEITMWGVSSVPSGWLECNGQSTSGYTALAALYGSNVPDLRGEFVRGWDNGKGTDSGRAILSTQADEFKSHNHTLNSYTGNGSPKGAHEGSAYNGSATTSGRGGSETRPRNLALMYIIKT